MKLCRFIYDEKPCLGVLKGETVYQIKEKNLFGSITTVGAGIPLNKIKFMCPTGPKTIFAVGLNYKDHAYEMNMKLPKSPLIFLKAVSSLTPHKSFILKPNQTKELSFEAELAVVVKKRCKNISVSMAAEYILGYSIVNDVTARDIQRIESQWTRAKSFDTFCPYGPVIETDISKVKGKIRSYINGRIIQDGMLFNMIFSPFEIFSYLSHQCTLEAGDIIATGTPKGVTTVKLSETVIIEIEGIGRLENKVIDEDKYII